MPNPATDRAVAPLWAAALGSLKWLELLVAAVALWNCFCGVGRVPTWLLVVAIASGLRLALDAGHRLRMGNALAVLWQSAERYARERGALPWRAALVLVGLPAGVLALANNRTAGGGDSWPVMPTACSLVLEGNWDVTEFVAAAPASYVPPGERLPYCTLRTPAGVYSSYPAGMVQFGLPAAAVARLLGADLRSPRVQDRLQKWAAAWVAALAAVLFFLTALHLAGADAAAVATLFLAAGSVLFSVVGQALWQHGGLIVWSLAALLIEFRWAGRPPARWALLQGVGFGMMAACRLSAALFVLPFGLWVLLRSPRRAVLVAAGGALGYLPWAALYLSVYGSPLGPSAVQMSGDLWAWSGEAALGLLVSPARGLFIYQPWAVLAALAVLPALLRRPADGVAGDCPAGWVWFCLAAVVLQVAMVASWRYWWGGHCWGSRLLAEAVPLCALLCVRPVALLLRCRGGRAALACLVFLAFWLHAVGVFWEPCWEWRVDLERHPEMLWSWSRPPFLVLWQRQP